MPEPLVWRGEYYAKNSEIQKEWREALFSDISFRGNEMVLDIGCGDGRLTADLSSLVKRGHVVGIDASLSMIKWARSHHAHLPNLTFDVRNVLKLSYKSAFDWILSSNCLHWVPDHKTVLENIALALGPGGAFSSSFLRT